MATPSHPTEIVYIWIVRGVPGFGVSLVAYITQSKEPQFPRDKITISLRFWTQSRVHPRNERSSADSLSDKGVH